MLCVNRSDWKSFQREVVDLTAVVYRSVLCWLSASLFCFLWGRFIQRVRTDGHDFSKKKKTKKARKSGVLVRIESNYSWKRTRTVSRVSSVAVVRVGASSWKDISLFKR